jgi:hypothetical protein
MFHRVGKTDGDNWEICPCLQGVPGTFKSSTISILQSYLQPGQFAVIATKTEKRFPISAAEGKFMVFLTETGGCDLDKELLKQMTCGDPLTVAVKFKTGSILSNFDVPMWFAGNSFLDCRDTDGSLERRFAVFPHTRVLRQGQGDTGLVKRIIAQERALILIKCNTVFGDEACYCRTDSAALAQTDSRRYERSIDAERLAPILHLPKVHC